MGGKTAAGPARESWLSFERAYLKVVSELQNSFLL
jgi:hypothetical protein